MSREVVSYELWIMRYELWGMNYEVWVRGKVVKLKYFASWKDSSLRYASFRMTGFCFLLTIRNLYYWGDFFESQRFFFLNCFFKWAKLAKFIRYEARWNMMRDTRCELKGASISITKFTEMGWNDCVFEGTEEHWRCCGKWTAFSVYVCRKEPILLWRDSSLRCASFRMTEF